MISGFLGRLLFCTFVWSIEDSSGVFEDLVVGETTFEWWYLDLEDVWIWRLWCIRILVTWACEGIDIEGDSCLFIVIT